MRPARLTGLTLIELMATLAILGILTAAALSAVAHLSRAQAADKTPLERQTAAASLRNLLEMDLTHAHRYRLIEDGFELQAQSYLEPGTLELKHFPATISYRLHEKCLVRIQELPGAQGQDVERRAELVLPAVRSLALKPVRQTGQAAIGQWLLMPEAVRIGMQVDGDEPATLEFVISREAAS